MRILTELMKDCRSIYKDDIKLELEEILEELDLFAPCSIVKQFRNFCSETFDFNESMDSNINFYDAMDLYQKQMSGTQINIINSMRKDLEIKEEIYDFRNERH